MGFLFVVYLASKSWITLLLLIYYVVEGIRLAIPFLGILLLLSIVGATLKK